MQNPKTTIPGYMAAFGTMLGMLSQMLPSKYSSTVMMAAIAVGGAGAALSGINAKDGGH